MKANRTPIGIALITILILLIVVIGPWNSDSSSTANTTEGNPNNKSAGPTLEIEAGNPVQLEDVAIHRTELEVTNDNLTVFEVRGFHGTPIVDAIVLVCRKQELLHRSVTDSLGDVEFPSDHAAMTLVISAPGRPVSLHSLSLIPGRHEVVLPEKTILSGRIIQADGTPPPIMRLKLQSDHPLFDSAAIPNEALEAIGLIPGSRDVLSTFTSPDGSFRFPGLAVSWSGFLNLPSGNLIQRSSAGQISPSQVEIKLEAPQPDLIIKLERPVDVRGQLIASQSRLPIDNFRLSSLSKPFDGGPQKFHFATTDHAGFFSLPLAPSEVQNFNLFFGSRFQKNLSILNLEAAEIPPNGDLGIIEVPSLRQIRFLLRDKDERPISSGVAKTTGIQSTPTNSEGEGLLPWVPMKVTRLRFLAPGFIPVEHELGEYIPDPLVVSMECGNCLEVEIIPPLGVKVKQFRAFLQSDSVIVNGPFRDDVELSDYIQDLTPIGLFLEPNAKLGSTLVSKPNSEGVVVFQFLRSDINLNLKIQGISGSTIYYSERLKPLGEKEIRRHVVDLTDSGRLFKGKISDLDGNPLVGASLQLGTQILARTDISGEFSCLVIESEPKTLILSHLSAATLYVYNFLVPQDESPVDFQLGPALRVIVNVSDESGAPITSARVSIITGGFAYSPENRGDGRFEVQGLGPEMITIRTEVAGRTYEQNHLPAQSLAHIVIPVHGSLKASLAASPQPGSGLYYILLKSLNSEEDISLNQTLSAVGGWQCDFRFVFPGEYEVSARYSPSAEEKVAGMASRTIGDVMTVQIEAGKTSNVSFD